MMTIDDDLNIFLFQFLFSFCSWYWPGRSVLCRYPSAATQLHKSNSCTSSFFTYSSGNAFATDVRVVIYEVLGDDALTLQSLSSCIHTHLILDSPLMLTSAAGKHARPAISAVVSRAHFEALWNPSIRQLRSSFHAHRVYVYVQLCMTELFWCSDISYASG